MGVEGPDGEVEGLDEEWREADGNSSLLDF